MTNTWGCSLYETIKKGRAVRAAGNLPLRESEHRRIGGAEGFADSSSSGPFSRTAIEPNRPRRLAAWYRAAGADEAAEMLEARSEIKDQESLYQLWPTAIPSYEWRDQLDKTAGHVRDGAQARPAPRAVASQASERFSVEQTEILPEHLASSRSPHFRKPVNIALREALDDAIDHDGANMVKPELLDVRACFGDAIAARDPLDYPTPPLRRRLAYSGGRRRRAQNTPTTGAQTG